MPQINKRALRPTKIIDRAIRRITWIGLLINLLLSGIKFVAGIFANSQVLIADAVHSLSDSVTDIAIIIGSFYWSKPPDQTHPYGHQRLETLVTLFIGSLLLAAGVGLGWHSLTMLQHPRPTHPGWPALAAAAVSIVTKEILYHWTARAGKRFKSTALSANAWHHRLDAFSSIPAFLAVGTAILFPSWMFIDLLGAFVVSIFIMQASFKIVVPCLKEILETGAPEKIYEMIRSVAEQHPNVLQVHNIRTRYIANRLQIDFHMVVEGSLSVREGHAISEDVRDLILNEGPEILDIVIHIEPTESMKDAEGAE
jgi:cation diffusion facilitator family transporter